MRAALIRAAAAVGIALFALGLAAPRPGVAELPSTRLDMGDSHAERVSHLARGRSPASRTECATGAEDRSGHSVGQRTDDPNGDGPIPILRAS